MGVEAASPDTEIIGRYKHDRPGYAAIALTTDTSALTAIANDYGFEQVFSRQVQGLGRRGEEVQPEILIPTSLYKKADAEQDPELR